MSVHGADRYVQLMCIIKPKKECAGELRSPTEVYR